MSKSINLQYVHLTNQFYIDYSHCKEAMQDPDRQYLHVLTKYKGNTYVIPFRSHINHRYCFKFAANDTKGLDYSKAMIINDNKYIIKSKKNIPQYQHDLIVRKESMIVRQFFKYVKDYCKAVQKNDVNALNRMGKFSTLQYFHEELGLK